MIKIFIRKKSNHDLFDSRICNVSGIGRSGTSIDEEDFKIDSLQSRFKRWKSFDSSQKMFIRICGEAIEFFEYKTPSI